MRAVKSEDTTPELIVRRVAHRLGYRFRLHVPDLPAKPDLVFPRLHKIIFVHGCFWHAHPCRRGNRPPKMHAAYWIAKRQRNHARDLRNIKILRRKHWRVLVIWECQTKNTLALSVRLRRFLA